MLGAVCGVNKSANGLVTGLARLGMVWQGEVRQGKVFTYWGNTPVRGLWLAGAMRGGVCRCKVRHGLVFLIGENVMFAELEVSIIGASPLLMHNGQTADPLNAFSKQLKAVSGKRKKTDEDYAEMSRIEWHAALYVDADGELILPSTLLEASIYDGAKKSKLGKAFKSSVFVNDDAKLDIGVKKKAEQLWGDDNYRDVRGVRVGQSRVMRTRPVFKTWACTFTVMYDPEQVNEAEVVRAIKDAGQNSGVGDFRPRFGRFEVKSIEA